MDRLVAFLDESRKPVRDRVSGRPLEGSEHYLVAAAIMFDGDLTRVRKRILRIERDLGFRLHYTSLRKSGRRQAALSAIADIPDWDALIVETARPLPIRNNSERHVRAKVLREALRTLTATHGVAHVVLETRSSPVKGFRQLDEQDHQVLQSLRSRHEVPAALSIDHRGKSEPLLAIADLVAGSRTDALCWADRTAFPIIAHRVRTTVRVGDALRDAEAPGLRDVADPGRTSAEG